MIALLQKVFLDMLCNQLQAQQEQIVRSDFKTSAQELLHVLDQDLHLNSQDLLKGTHETATHVWRLDIAIQNGERARWEEERRNLQLLKSDFPLTTYAQLLVEFLKNVNAVIWEEEPTARWSHNSPPRKRDSSSAVKEACRACIVVIVCIFPPSSQSDCRNELNSVNSNVAWRRGNARWVSISVGPFDKSKLLLTLPFYSRSVLLAAASRVWRIPRGPERAPSMHAGSGR